MRIAPSRLTVMLLFAAAGVFAFNCILELRYKSAGRAGIYGILALLWAVLGWMMNVRRNMR